MSVENVQERVKIIIVEQLGVEADQVKPEAQSLVSTQIIGGKKYIVIESTDAVEVNGIDIKIAE